MAWERSCIWMRSEIVSLEDLESAEIRLISWRFFSRSDPSGVLLNLGLRVWVRERK